MADFKILTTAVGEATITCYSVLPRHDDGRPVIVLIHGALRHAGVLAHWAERLAGKADILLVDLPGHGRSSASGPTSIEGMAAAVHQALLTLLPGRAIVLVGESLGGAVALAMGGLEGPVRGVFAADPPLTTAKLWHVHGSFQQVLANGEQPFFRQMGKDVFGMTPDGIEERIYYPLIGALRVPAIIATGDIALLPPRRMAGVACLIDPVDLFVLESLYAEKVEVAHIAGCGHLLLTDAQDQCEALILRLLTGAIGHAPPP